TDRRYGMLRTWSRKATKETRMSNLDAKIAKMEARLKQLRARQVQQQSRRRSVESRRTRGVETRKKILVGAIVFSRVEQGRLESSTLHTWLDEALTRQDDRELFNLAR